MITLLFRALFLFFVSVAVAKGQADEHPLLVVQHGKKQIDLKQGLASKMERVKKGAVVAGAFILPVLGSLGGTVGGIALRVQLEIESGLKAITFVWISSVLGSIGGYWATKLLPGFSHKKKVAVGGAFSIPIALAVVILYSFSR